MNNARWTWFAIGYQTVLAYLVSLCVYQIGTFIAVGSFGLGTAVAAVVILGFIYLLVRPAGNISLANRKGMAKA